MWVDVTMTPEGAWYSKGKLFNRFRSDWAEREPAENSDGKCVVVSASVGYKMIRANCLETHRFLCMANKPECPVGYTWLPQFGAGTSCFNLTPPTMEAKIYNANDTRADVTIAENYCRMDKTRLAVPETEQEMSVLRLWFELISSDPDSQRFHLGIYNLGPDETISDSPVNMYRYTDRSEKHNMFYTQ